MDYSRAIRSAVPTFEPLTIAEAKKHLELAEDDASHDGHLRQLIALAREVVEHDTGIVCATGTYTLVLDDFPPADEIMLPVRPVSSVTSITYLDSAGSTQTMSSADYVLDNNHAIPRVRLAYLDSWPGSRGTPNAVTITFVAGYATQAAVSQTIKQACLLTMARAFQDREGFERTSSDRAYEMLTARHARASYP